MAKRANPFTEDFIPQSKVHIGMKQFKNNDDRLKKVYEKTLELLFKGAKKGPAVDVLDKKNVHFTKKNEKMKQLCIGKDGSLLNAGFCVMEYKTATKQCSCGGTAEFQCAYCDTALCGMCQHGCKRCEGTFCMHCILIGFESSETCVSCCG